MWLLPILTILESCTISIRISNKSKLTTLNKNIYTLIIIVFDIIQV